MVFEKIGSFSYQRGHSDGNMLIYILVYGWNYSVIFHPFINPDIKEYENYL